MTITDTDRPDTRPTTSRGRLAWIGAAAAVAIVVGGLVLLARDDDAEPDVPATVPPTPAPTTTSPPTTTTPAVPVEDAVGRAEQFLATFASGDPAQILALQTDDFAMRYTWPGEDWGEDYHVHEWLGATYQAANAAVYSEPACSLIAVDAGVTSVECDTTMALAAHQAANAPGLPVTMTIRVTPDGVAGMESRYGQNAGLLAFYDWVDVSRPGELADYGDIDLTVEQITDIAQTEARLASDWASFAVDLVEATWADHDAGDLDAFLARYADGAEVLGIVPRDARDVVGALMAGGQTYSASNCGTDGIAGRLLIVACDVVVRPPSHARSGVETTGRVQMFVGADGAIERDSGTIDRRPLLDFDAAFAQWLADAHPDVHGQIEWLAATGGTVASANDQATIAAYYQEFVDQSDDYPLGG